MKKETKFGVFYQKYLNCLVPSYGILSVIACFVFNSLIYTGTQILMGDVYHYDLTTEWDRKVPFVQEWILIYLVCFGFWALNYILIVREGKEHWYRFAMADMMSRAICAVFFVLFPTTNVRPEVVGDGLISTLVRFVYAVDPATNLFPSIHCLVSWFCFVGIRKSKKIPLWYKVFSCIFAILVCMSTQFTKQHYLVDIPGGILLAELCYFITTRTGFYKKLESGFDKIGRKIFGVNCYDD